MSNRRERKHRKDGRYCLLLRSFRSLWFIFPLLAATACFAAEPVTVAEGRFAEIRPAWSPDGAAVAYVLREAGAGREIWRVSVDGTDARRLAADVASRSDVDWSPDGRWIAYTGRRPKRGVMIVRADGTTRPRLLVPGGAFARWHPGRPRLACVDGTNVFISGLDGKPARLTDEKSRAIFRGLAWSPNGAFLASDRNGDVCLLEVKRGARWRVVASHGSGAAAPFRRPAFSADGRFLYYTIDRAGVYDAAAGSDGLGRVQVTTARAEVICDVQSWSLARTAHVLALCRGRDIFLRHPTTGAGRKVARGVAPCLSPDAHRLAFIHESDTNADGITDFRDKQRLMVMDIAPGSLPYVQPRPGPLNGPQSRRRDTHACKG